MKTNKLLAESLNEFLNMPGEKRFYVFDDHEMYELVQELDRVSHLAQNLFFELEDMVARVADEEDMAALAYIKEYEDLSADMILPIFDHRDDGAYPSVNSITDKALSYKIENELVNKMSTIDIKEKLKENINLYEEYIEKLQDSIELLQNNYDF